MWFLIEKYYCIEKIDYKNSVVYLVPTDNKDGIRYRQRKIINNIVRNDIKRSSPALKINNSVLEKKIISADVDVNTCGYYQFDESISLMSGTFKYYDINSDALGLRRNYKSVNLLAVNINSDVVQSMGEEERFKVSFTISLLINEIFETLSSNMKQYIITRAVVSDDKLFYKYTDDELFKMYTPIVDSNVEDGINIYITEDTELEKGLLDTIDNNFYDVVINVMTDYLSWLLCDFSEVDYSEWHSTVHGDSISIEANDKKSFLKYGFEDVPSILSIEKAFSSLSELIAGKSGNWTQKRMNAVSNRSINNPFADLEEPSSKEENSNSVEDVFVSDECETNTVENDDASITSEENESLDNVSDEIPSETIEDSNENELESNSADSNEEQTDESALASDEIPKDENAQEKPKKTKKKSKKKN